MRSDDTADLVLGRSGKNYGADRDTRQRDASLRCLKHRPDQVRPRAQGALIDSGVGRSRSELSSPCSAQHPIVTSTNGTFAAARAARRGRRLALGSGAGRDSRHETKKWRTDGAAPVRLYASVGRSKRHAECRRAGIDRDVVRMR
jgi:hypothetical protein